MKNKEILPDTLVPKKIRQEVYAKTLEMIQNGELSNESTYPYGLCRFFPMILWELDNVYQPAPNGEGWHVNKIKDMFPELKKILKKYKVKKDYLTPKQRLDFLIKITNKTKKKYSEENMRKAFEDGIKYDAGELELDTNGRDSAFEVWLENYK